MPGVTADNKEVCVNECVTLTGTPAGGTWLGTGVTGNQFCATNLAPGAYPVTYRVVNASGCTSSASALITVKICGGAICTYTQGAYGNAGGKACDGKINGISTVGIISQALANWGGTLTLGKPGRSVIMLNNPANVNCIIAVLPGGGSSKELTGGNYNVCNLPDAYLKGGRINNTLLSQTMTLGLNLGIANPSPLASFVLQAGVMATAAPQGGCGSNTATPRICNYNPIAPFNLVSVSHEYQYRSISASVVNAIVGPKTVAGLFELANRALANVDGVLGKENEVDLSSIAGAVDAINNIFDECRIFVGWNVAPCAPFSLALITSTEFVFQGETQKSLVAELNVSAYPNPYTDKVRFVITSPVSGQGTLELFNLAGQKIQTVNTGLVFAGKGQVIEYNVPSAHRTSLIYILRVGGQQVTGKLTNAK